MQRFLFSILIPSLLLISSLTPGGENSSLVFSSDDRIPLGIKNLVALELQVATGKKWNVRDFDPDAPSLPSIHSVFVINTSEAKRLLSPDHPLLKKPEKSDGESFALISMPEDRIHVQIVAADSRRMLLAGAFELARRLRLDPSLIGNINASILPAYPIRITNDSPIGALCMGYNTVESRWDAARVALFKKARPPVFEKGDKGRRLALENRLLLKQYLSLADTLDLDVIAYGDEFQFPLELVLSDHYRPLVTERGFREEELESQWGMGRIFCFAKPRLWDLYHMKYRELFRDFPSVDYIQVRLGENTTFGRKKGYAGSGIYSIGGAPYCDDCRDIPYEDRIARVIRENLQLAAAEAGKKYIHRTWDTSYDRFNNNPEVFRRIMEKVGKAGGLYLSTKYTFGDFWEYFDYNPTLTDPPPIPRILEFQCTREYEGKGAFPNFLGEEFCSVYRWLKEKKVPVAGISNWHHGGGTGGPCPAFDLWNQANIYAARRLAWEPDLRAEEIAREFALLSFGPRSVHPITRLLLLSDDAVRKMRYFEVYSSKHKNRTPAELWIRDDVIRGERSLYRIFRAVYKDLGSSGIDALLDEKMSATELVEKMQSLLRSQKEAILSLEKIYLPWGDKREIGGMTVLLDEEDATTEPLFISGKDLYDFAETSLLYERALAEVLYRYCGCYFLAQRYRRTLDPGDKRLALRHFTNWEKAWSNYTVELPKSPFCPTLFKDDGMKDTLERALYFLEHPDILDLHWMIAGPFPNPEKRGFDMVFPPEKGIDLKAEMKGLDQTVHWKPLHEDRYIEDLVDLSKLFYPDDWITMYAFTEFECPKEQKALVLVGSDDAVKVWLNGDLVHSNNVYRAASPGQDRAPVNLRKGKNRLLVKLMEGIFGCGFYLSFTTPEGDPVPGLKGATPCSGK